MLKKALFGALAICATVLLLPSIASAAPPEIEVSEFSGTSTLPGICGDGIDLTNDFDSRATFRTFFDADGVVTSEKVHSVGVQLWTRSDTENTITRRSAFNIELTYIDGVVAGSSLNGLFALAIVPGEGPVLLGAGREVNDVDFNTILTAGPKVDISWFFADICDSLA